MAVPLPLPPPPPPPPPSKTLTVVATQDYRGTSLGEKTAIVFATTDFANAVFNSNQFGLGKISDTVAITGDANRNFIDVRMLIGGSFSAAGWTFTNWVPFTPQQNDQVNLTGSDDADTITGSSQADSIVGNGGNDTLNGGEGNDIIVGGAGLDTLSGGAGDDTYHLSDLSPVGPSLFAFDSVQENTDGGIDTVLVHRIGSVTGYSIALNVENVFVNGAGAFDVFGNVLGNKITGNEDANILEGRAGADTLIGQGGNDSLVGGDGDDTMTGGAGDDAYVVDNAADVVVEGAGQGTLDSVAASASYVLGAGVEVEVLGTTSSGGTTAIDLTGNEFVQAMSGNGGANRLDGKGGADTMKGLGGNDVYIVDSAGDLVIEGVGQGTADWAAASVSYALGAGSEVEVLSTTASGGSAAINLTGNEFAQIIAGNAGANRLDGKGGADTMKGLGGNDVYIADNAGDRVIEGAGQGTLDWVATSVSYALDAGVQAEKLSTTVSVATTAINLTGNAFAQIIVGNAGANIISGKAGNDTLAGLGGADIFVFDTGLNATTNVDRITDFNVAADTVRLENAIFTQIAGTGTLTAAQFVKNTTGLAQDASDRIVYETDTGKLFYDTNGNAAGGSFHFGTLGAGLALTNADFQVI